jgi:hypothetical protein
MVRSVDRWLRGDAATGALIFYSLFVMSANARLVWTIPLVIFGLTLLVRRREARRRRIVTDAC